MNVSEIPFVKHVGVQENDGTLSLVFDKNMKNHIQTFHAGAQFTLAEAQVGVFLQKSFPELEGKVVPVLRESKLKYKRPALSKIHAKANCPAEEMQKFKNQLEKKGRAIIEVFAQVFDENDTLTCEGSFIFFVQVT